MKYFILSVCVRRYACVFGFNVHFEESFFLLNIISTFLNSTNPLYDIKLFDKKTIQSIQSSLWQMTVFQLPLLLLPFFQLL